MTNFQLYIALMAAACGMWWVAKPRYPLARLKAWWIGGKVVEITHRDGSTSVHVAHHHVHYMQVPAGQFVLVLLHDGRVFMHPSACTWREL